MQAGVVQNTRIDELNIAATTGYAIEQFERIEVVNGLACALDGPANPAGTFNYVVKRPTAAALNAVTFGYTSQSSFIEHADVSHRFGKDGWLGVRVNLQQAGGNPVDRSDLKRRPASVALDMQLRNATQVELDGSIDHYIGKGLPGTFSLARHRLSAEPRPRQGGPAGGTCHAGVGFGGRRQCLRVDIFADAGQFAAADRDGEDPVIGGRRVRGFDYPRGDPDDHNPILLGEVLPGFGRCIGGLRGGREQGKHAGISAVRRRQRPGLAWNDPFDIVGYQGQESLAVATTDRGETHAPRLVGQ